MAIRCMESHLVRPDMRRITAILLSAATLLAADAGYASLTFAQRATNRRPVSPLQVSGARLPFADA